VLQQLQDWIEWIGLSGQRGLWTARVLLIILLLVLCFLADRLALKILVGGMRRLAARTRTQLDDLILRARVFNNLAHIAPALILYASAGLLFPEPDSPAAAFVSRVANAYMYLVSALCIGAILEAIGAVYQNAAKAEARTINGLLGLAKSLLWVVAGILILSELMEKDPWNFIASLGAITAIILLVFKDSILGFVASIQIATKDLVRVGDWIEFKRYGADGNVVNLSLTTVQVQNWDNTISTIPTYALVADSFRNWRGMTESDGRRIKRALYLDMNSVQFCDEELLDRFEKIQLIRDYVQQRRQEVAEHNRSLGQDAEHSFNGRRLTNLGTFRHYVNAYLRSHADVHPEMTLLVRQLQPTEKGVPLEVYCFSKDKAWVSFEGIQSDLFDHLLAILPAFDLHVFQSPSGNDLQALQARAVAASEEG
jgi:miniconductance mechanosensitive channel